MTHDGINNFFKTEIMYDSLVAETSRNHIQRTNVLLWKLIKKA